MNQIEEYNNIHEGKPIFIIGNGTCLKDLTEEQISIVSKNITIGCNASHLVFEETDYYITGHLVHLLFSNHYGKCSNRIFQGQPILSKDFLKTFNIIQTTEKNLNFHIKNINLMLDTSNLHSIDISIKKNRLELLYMLCKTFENYLNFSKIENVK